ncbi:hypothetical protein GN956_G10590 [Arapaima gigas]
MLGCSSALQRMGFIETVPNRKGPEFPLSSAPPLQTIQGKGSGNVPEGSGGTPSLMSLSGSRTIVRKTRP